MPPGAEHYAEWFYHAVIFWWGMVVGVMSVYVVRALVVTGKSGKGGNDGQHGA